MSSRPQSAESGHRSLAHRLGAWSNRRIATLYPGAFALVMATGIVSNTLFFEGRRGLSDALFAANLVAYPGLLCLTAWRAVRFWRAMRDDLLDPHLVFSFFTIVAGTDVFGVGIHLRGFGTAALALWTFALIVWAVLTYVSFAVLTFVNTAQGAGVVHGGWLVAIVGTQSLVVLGTAVAPESGFGAALLVPLHMLWGVGLGLYGVFIVLFSYRIFFFDVGPDDVTPLLWVVMGAAAIGVNAGVALIASGGVLPYLDALRPFVEGITLVMWAWASWWIPLLLLLGIWKHGARRVKLTYTPMLWSLVFPLGMYALASLRLSLAADFPPLQTIALAMMWIALAAWAATAAGFAVSSWRSFRGA